jgi:UDP:flavonoid glycosyltransferase YjiC (YdhE family)
MRILFLNIPAVGHITPTLPLVRELQPGGETFEDRYREAAQKLSRQMRSAGGIEAAVEVIENMGNMKEG